MKPLTLFKSLADDTRLKCMLLIKDQGELCVCELMEALDQGQPKVSRNLALLRSESLLQSTKQGQWVYYSLHQDLPDWVSELLETTLQNSPTTIATNLESLEKMGDRPERLSLCCD